MRRQWNQYLKPVRDAVCPRESCVYNEHGYCDEPYINYGNGDAECHSMSYRQVVEILGVAPRYDAVPKVPAVLDRITDVVLNYRPKAVTKKAKKRQRKARKK